MLSSFLLVNSLYFGVHEIIHFQKLVRNLDKITVANLGGQHHRSLDSYFKSSWEYLHLFGVINYNFIPSILLEVVVYIFPLILLMFFLFPQWYDNFTPLLILIRRQHLDNMTFCWVSQTCHTKEGEQVYVEQVLKLQTYLQTPWIPNFIGSLLVSQLVGLTNTNPHNTKLAGIIFMRQLAPPVIANDSTIKGSHCHAHSELTRYNNAHSTHNHETNNYSPPFHIRATALHTWPRAMRKHGVVFLFKIDDQEKSKSLFKVSVTRHNVQRT